MTDKEKRERAQRRGKLEVDGDGRRVRTFWLKDYLGPNGRYPYEDLPTDLDLCYRAGEDVYLLDVPRLNFAVCASQHLRGYERPWSDSQNRYYCSVYNALKSLDGKRGPGRAPKKSVA